MFFLNKYISKLLIVSLIIISFYNIFSILMLSFSSRIEGNLIKTFNYLPYKYTIFFQKPLLYSRKDIQANNSNSKKLHQFISNSEKKSVLDYTYWELKMLYQISSQDIKKNFERDIINFAILSKNNIKKKKSLRLFYLRNIPRFSKELSTIILDN